MFYERSWNLNVTFADQSSQLSSVTFVNTKSVALALFQRMWLGTIGPQNALHAIEEK